LLQFREVHNPTTVFSDFAFQADANMEGMTVQAGALMTLWHIGEAVGRLEMKFFVYLHCGRILLPKTVVEKRPRNFAGKRAQVFDSPA
jgi:hypothetical protein